MLRLLGSALVAVAVCTNPSVERYGQSGKFAVCPTSNCPEQSIVVQVDFIRELDASGKKIPHHFRESMASTTFTVGDVEDVRLGQPPTTASKYPFSATIGVGHPKSPTNALLRFDTYFVRNSTQVIIGNSSVNVPQGALKFDIAVSQWAFADEENTLEVGIKVDTKGASNKDAPLLPGDGRQNKTADFGNMYFSTPLTGLYDGEEKAVDVSEAASGHSKVVVFNFESFTQEVIYDPIMGGKSETSNNGGNSGSKSAERGIGGGAIAGIVIGAVVLVGAAGFFIYRKMASANANGLKAQLRR